MKSLRAKNLERLLVVALTLPTAGLAFPVISRAQATPTLPALVTQFRCVPVGKDFATIAARGNRVTPPMILWTRSQGGFSAQERCRIVTQNFNDAVNRNGGMLRRLSLTSGVVNNSTVICSVTTQQLNCIPDNVIMTLRPDDNPQELLQQIKDFSISANTRPVIRGENQPDVYDLGLAVDRFLNQADMSPQSPTAPGAPGATNPQGQTSTIR